ncbi:MAG TPA: outer membrane beta-barrel protein [Terracidiphilus sp.]|nr:outer membrane beta-barrel protein [Terracidiphilus sp.]
MKRMWAAALIVGTALLMSGPLAHAQFDVAGSFFDTFNSSTTGNGTIEKPKNSPGGMVEFRYIRKPLLGFELSYSFNPANESFSVDSANCGLRCNNAPVTVTSDNHMVEVNWVLTTKRKFAGLHPFALVGPGFVISEPTTNDYAVNSRVRISFDYGGGVDFAITPKFGLRAQIRGALYKAPDLYVLYSPTGVAMQTLQPSFGVYFRL